MIVKMENLNACLKFIKDTYLQTIKNEDTTEGQIEFVEHYVYGEKTIADFNKGIESYFGYYDNETLVGVISLNNEGYIKFLFVSKKVQKKGIGGKLLKYIEEYAIQQGYMSLYLDSSLNGVEFYRRKGFDIACEKTKANGIWFQPMKKKIV